MATIQAIETEYNGCYFRSRLEARWSVFFDTLGVEWEYEPEHYELGLKRPWLQDEYEFREYLNERIDDERDWGYEREIIRDAYREKYEQVMYLPDFILPGYEHWIEIKGKHPNAEERQKASRLARQTRKPVHILWGDIQTQMDRLGECTEVFGADMNIIATLVIEHGLKRVLHAFTCARQAHF
jgi:hypothetical protein